MTAGEWIAAWRVASRCAALGALCVVAVWIPLAIHARTLPAAPWETDARLPGMPSGERHAALILGSSRAYLLSRFAEHHPMLEEALGGPVFNAAMPTGGGIRPARLYLEEYLARGNRPGAVLYCLDPFVLFGEASNDAHKFVYFEPLEAGFLLRMFLEGHSTRQIFTYARSKLSWDWFTRGPQPLVRHDGRVRPEDVNPERIAMRFESLYLDGMSEGRFNRYCAALNNIEWACASRNIPLRIVFLPTLLGHEPGMAQALDCVWPHWASQPGPPRADWTNAMPDPALYYNLDHLNTDGVEVFLREHLGPWFRAQAG